MKTKQNIYPWLAEGELIKFPDGQEVCDDFINFVSPVEDGASIVTIILKSNPLGESDYTTTKVYGVHALAMRRWWFIGFNPNPVLVGPTDGHLDPVWFEWDERKSNTKIPGLVFWPNDEERYEEAKAYAAANKMEVYFYHEEQYPDEPHLMMDSPNFGFNPRIGALSITVLEEGMEDEIPVERC